MATQTVIAYPSSQNVPALNDFLAKVFGAVEKERAVGSAGGYHTELLIGDTRLMVGGGGAGVEWNGEARPMAFHIYVPDVDTTWKLAQEQGAESLQAPANQEWGERTANVKDLSGNFWYIATFQGSNYFSDGAPTVQPFLQPLRAAPVIDFMKAAFAANELGRATTPEGVILHTTVKIGNSAMELIDAVGIYQPMPGRFFVTVEDADYSYALALASGAKPVSPPADQPYGARVGGVEDIAGNLWYVASELKK